MEDKLISVLETYGFPVRRQGSFASEENYPDHFFTFWNVDTFSEQHYDNNVTKIIHVFDVYFYSIDVEKLYQTIKDVVKSLKSQGWLIVSYGFDAASDEPTHTGRGIEIRYIDQEV